MKTTELMEKSFTEEQIAVIKATVRSGYWGELYKYMASGEMKAAYGYSTSGVRVDGLTAHQIAGIYSEIAKVIEENKFEFIAHTSDFLGDGKGMLFISSDVDTEVSMWAI